MWGIFLILILTLVVLGCTLVIVRRSPTPNNPNLYLRSPTWKGLPPNDGSARDLTAPAGPADAPVAPANVRVRAAGEGAGADRSKQQDHVLDEVVAGLQRIEPLPHVLFQILGELDAAGSTARSLASIVSTEPVLTASLLRVANSAATALSRRIISVDEAVAYLGYSMVRSLVLRMKLAQLMPSHDKRGYNSEHLWLHSLAVSQIASHLANQIGGTDAWLVSTLGLLHDIGKLAINSQFPERVEQLITPRKTNDSGALVVPGDESFLARERRLFGADHAVLGALLAAQWKLPAELVDAIRLHHLPHEDALVSLSPELRRATQVVHVANQLAKYLHVYCADMEIDIVPESLLRELNLPTDLEALLTDGIRQIVARTQSTCRQ